MEEAHPSNLLSTIEKEALAEKEKLERTYSEQIKKIHEEAEKEASRLREEGLRAGDKQLQTERLRRIGKAEQELKKALLVARHRIIENVLKAVEEEMEAIRNNKTLYPKIFREMFSTAIREFQGKVIIHVNEQDRALCEGLLKELNRPYTLETPSHLKDR
ncbi:MAG TPA: V-type ATP synthase subunit E, partial [Candidatus Hypogeohydataceae bacterium YC38]